MAYRANKTLHKGTTGKVGKNNFFNIGDEVPEDHPSFKHWKNKGYLNTFTPGETEEPAGEPVEPVDTGSGETPVDTGISDLDFIDSTQAEVLQEAGILSVSDLEDWTKDELVKLQGIGAKTAEKLLAL